MAMLPRRTFLKGGAAALVAPLMPSMSFASSPAGQPLHGLSAFGDLKYKPDFAQFDYVNVDAPKGGTFNFSVPNWVYNQSPVTFNTLNSFVAKGDAPPRMEFCYDSLMVSALDEPDSVYGLLAQTVTISEDRNSFEFALRPEAKFHDGTPLTAEDVVWTLKTFKENGHPDLYLTLVHLSEAVAVAPQTLKLTFDGKQSDRTILDVVTFPILSKAYFEKAPFDGSRLEPPLGSGPYKVGLVSPGQTIEYNRVEDYWARDLPVNRGIYNFDRIRLEFYSDRQAAFEAFKKGQILYREEFTSRIWATSYDFPALTAGKVVKREFPGELRPSMQATAVNERRERFRDGRVRRAIALCFDFEWTNRSLFYDLYERSDSCFEKSPYKAEGSPSADELALLEPLRGKIPDEAFGEVFKQPSSNGSGRDRKLMGEAAKLFAEAGWKREGSFLQNDRGERFALELLIDEEGFVRIFSPWVENLKAIGVDASIRMVDPAQYQARQAEFDFDMISMALQFSATPTRDSVESIFHSKSAALSASKNLPGIADPGVDALVDAVGRADSHVKLQTAMRALDRVLRARMDWIPSWNSPNHRVAYWDMFGFTEPKPDYGFPIEALWWFDKDKAAAVGKG